MAFDENNYVYDDGNGNYHVVVDGQWQGSGSDLTQVENKFNEIYDQAHPAEQQPAPPQPTPTVNPGTNGQPTGVYGVPSTWTENNPAGSNSVTNAGRTVDQMRSELRVAGYNGPWDDNSVTAAFDRTVNGGNRTSNVTDPWVRAVVDQSYQSNSTPNQQNTQPNTAIGQPVSPGQQIGGGTTATGDDAILDAIWTSQAYLKDFYQKNGWDVSTPEKQRAAVRNWIETGNPAWKGMTPAQVAAKLGVQPGWYTDVQQGYKDLIASGQPWTKQAYQTLMANKGVAADVAGSLFDNAAGFYQKNGRYQTQDEIAAVIKAAQPDWVPAGSSPTTTTPAAQKYTWYQNVQDRYDALKKAGQPWTREAYQGIMGRKGVNSDTAGSLFDNAAGFYAKNGRYQNEDEIAAAIRAAQPGWTPASGWLKPNLAPGQNPYSDPGLWQDVNTPGSKSMEATNPQAQYQSWINAVNAPTYSKDYLTSQYGKWYNDYSQQSANDATLTWADYLKGKDPAAEVAKASPFQRGENPRVYSPKMRWVTQY